MKRVRTITSTFPSLETPGVNKQGTEDTAGMYISCHSGIQDEDLGRTENITKTAVLPTFFGHRLG